jgi:phage terminase small subunit
MIDVRLNTSIGRNMMSLMFGLQVAINSLDNRIENEKKAVIKAANTVLDQRPLYDMRFNATKEFFKNPLNAERLPVIKQSEVKRLESNTKLIYKSLGRINAFNSNVAQIKNNALMKGLRSNL